MRPVWKGKCLLDLGGEACEKRPLGRPSSSWEDNIKIDLQEIGWGVDWIHLAQDKEGWRAVMNFRFPYNWGGHFSKWAAIRFFRECAPCSK
jgi:hypothetical protein